MTLVLRDCTLGCVCYWIRIGCGLCNRNIIVCAGRNVARKQAIRCNEDNMSVCSWSLSTVP